MLIFCWLPPIFADEREPFRDRLPRAAHGDGRSLEGHLAGSRPVHPEQDLHQICAACTSGANEDID
jgi:hypothetical protein